MMKTEQAVPSRYVALIAARIARMLANLKEGGRELEPDAALEAFGDIAQVTHSLRQVCDRAESDRRCGELCVQMLLAAEDFFQLRLHARDRLDFLDCAVREARRRRWREAEARLSNLIGVTHWQLGDVDTAAEYCQEAAQIAGRIGRIEIETSALANVGNVQILRGQPGASLMTHVRALELFRRLDDRRSEAKSLVSIGRAYQALREYETATQCLAEGLTIARSVGDVKTEGEALGTLATTLRQMGKPEEAIEPIGERLRLARRTGDKWAERAAVGNLGNVLKNLGRLDEAERCHRESLTLSRELGDRRGEAADQCNLGQVYLARGDAAEALPLYEAARSTFAEIGDKVREAVALWNAAHAYHDTGQLETAIRSAEAALTIRKTLGITGVEDIEEHIAQWYEELQQARPHGN